MPRSPSLEILKQSILELFKMKGLSTPSILFEDGDRTLNFPSKDSIEDVIFFGNALNYLGSHKPFKRKCAYRLWALSTSHAKLIARYLGLEASTIGVINRYELFPMSKSPKRLDLQSPMHFVYSGRIVSGKNVELIPKVLARQSLVPVSRIELHICYNQFDPKILSTVKDRCIQRNLRLHDHGDLGIDWMEKFKGLNCALINLSTYGKEDFNISLAQADQNGLPKILSEWGAFLDLQSPNRAMLGLGLLDQIEGEPLISIPPKCTEIDRCLLKITRPTSNPKILARAIRPKILPGNLLGELLQKKQTAAELNTRKENENELIDMHLNALSIAS